LLMEDKSFQKEILETLSKASMPLKPGDIARKTGLGFSSLITHLKRLVNAGYVSTPKRGFYALTDTGQAVLGTPDAEEETASTILSSVSLEKAFRFHRGLDEDLGVSATSLSDFRQKIQTVDLRSIEFHLLRQDFESWINDGLGDSELAHRISLIRTMGLSGEPLRRKLYETVTARYDELETLSHRA
jgi:DNA-binding transcriptional ArsR family regulator